MFDSLISQAEDMYTKTVAPALDVLHADLTGMKGSSVELDASVDALTTQVTALQTQMLALQKTLAMSNKLEAASLRKPKAPPA